MRRTTPLVLVALFALAACGGDESTASNDSVVLGADADAGAERITDSTLAAATPEPATPDPETPDPETPDPETPGTTVAGASGAVVVPLELDECLVGEWEVSLETIGSLIALAVLPVPDLSVPVGGFTVTLADDGTVAGAADFTGAFSLGASPAEADVRWTGTGSWGTLDGTVTLALDQQEGGVTEVRIDGEAQPGSQLDAELPISGGAYTCTPARLEVAATAGDATIPLVFER